MKNCWIVILLTLFLITSCTPTENDEFSEFVHPDPETYVTLMPLIREYFFYRKQAVLNGDMDGFFDRYPALEVGMNIDQGINIEASQVHNMQSLDPFDANISPEYYEKIRVRKIEAEIHISVHGIALYLWKDSEGLFNESGGEFMIVIYAREQGDNWQIYKTDEVTLMEQKGINYPPQFHDLLIL